MDGQQMEAHKVILAASSLFFMDILKENKHQHPLIYMKGLKASDLTAIIVFIYLGEADILQDNMDDFLAIAEELQLKGIVKEVPADNIFSQEKILQSNYDPSITNKCLEQASIETLVTNEYSKICRFSGLDLLIYMT